MQILLKKIFLSLILVFLLVACEKKTETTQTTFKKYGNPYGIPWEKDLPTAFKKAKNENKIVMVMAVSEGCKWCEKMKKETLSNPKVMQKLKNYVLVMADRETAHEREQLPPFQHVPIVFFLTHEKEELDNLRGYFAPNDFLEYLNDFEEE
ncbi:thioredoxin family protein [Sulfurimonas sp.]